MFYIFIEDNKINGCGQAKILNDNVINYEVDEVFYNEFAQNPDKYIWDGLKIVENPNYEQEQRLKQIEIELMQADETYKIQLDTPVQYTNGHLYKPKWVEETYINLLTAGSMIPTMFPMQIWDSTEVEENVVLMTLEELQVLTKYLASIQQHYFDERKVLKSQLLNEKKKLIAKTNNIQKQIYD